MRKTKLTPQIEKIILKERRKNPLFGCRKLSSHIMSKYSISLSKSLINKLLLKHGIKEKVGKKSETVPLKTKTISHCGFFLTRATELDLHFEKILLESIGVAFPHSSGQKLLGMIDFFLYMHLLGLDASKSQKAYRKSSNLWRMVSNSKPLSLKLLNSFSKKWSQDTFLFSFLINNLVGNLQEVYAIRLSFQGGFSIYLDPQLRCLWSDSSAIPAKFRVPLKKAREMIANLKEGAPLVIMNIPCFGNFAPFFSKFVHSASSQIASLEILGKNDETLEKVKLPRFLNFIVGFFPRDIIQAGSLQKVSRYYRYEIEALDEWVHIGEFKIKSLQLFDKKDITARNVLIRRAKNRPPSWGILTNIKNINIKELINKYTFSWPYLDTGFRRFLKIIELASFKDSGTSWEMHSNSLKAVNNREFWPVFLRFLNDYFAFRFLPFSAKFADSDYKTLFESQGRISKKTKHFFKIFFHLPSTFTQRDFLIQAFYNMNEADILWSGRKVLFFLT